MTITRPTSKIFQKTLLLRFLLVLGIGAYPVFFIFQGIDFTDFGFSSSNYKFIFTNPASIYTTLFPIYLTDVIGGICHRALGFLGLIGFKVSYILEQYLMIYLIYRVLIRFFDSVTVLVSLLVSAVYLNYYEQGTLNWISYNDLTALFYVSIVMFLFRGLTEDKERYLVLSGIFLGLNFFVRVSNLSGLMLVLAIVADFLSAREKSSHKLFLRCGHFIAGVMIGILLVISFMAVAGHLKLYMESYTFWKTFGGSLTPAHEMKGNILLYLSDFFQSLTAAAYFLFIGLLLLLSSKYLIKFTGLTNRLLLLTAAVAAACLLSCFDFPMLHKIKSLYHVRWIFWRSGVLFLALLYILAVQYKRRSPLFILVLLSLMVFFITPLGSNRSLLNANFGMWLGMPLVLSFFIETAEIRPCLFRLDRSSSFFAKALILSVIALYGLNANLHETFRDSSDRWGLTSPVHHRYFVGLYTTKDRAVSIDELNAAIERCVHSTDYVLSHEYAPMLNYLTDCPPYMFNPNPMYFSWDVYRYLYAKARTEIRQFPVIIAAKGLFDKEWPKSVNKGLKHPNPQYNSLFNLQRGLIENLKRDGKYYKIWENNFFEIWRPTEERRGSNESISFAEGTPEMV